MHIQNYFIADNLSERRKLIADIFSQSPLFDFEACTVNQRYLEDKHGHWLADFATQSYLGFDFHPEVIGSAQQGLQKYGVVVAWCRLVATVNIFNQVEQQIAKLVGTEACSVFASTTLLNHGVIPALAGKDGLILLDKSAHATMYEGAKIARDSGALLQSYPTHDLEALEKLLQKHADIKKKLILTDGVYSMTGGYANLPELDRLAKKYHALLFVDDAHGFGVVGEKPSLKHPYGHKGNGLVNYYGLNYDNIIYVGCFSKAYGSYGAFIACSSAMREFLLSQATPHDLGGAGPAAALCAVEQGLKINAERGEQLRQKMHSLTQKAVNGLRQQGYRLQHTTGFPIISVLLGHSEHIIEISHILYRQHILLTLAPYPMVAKGQEALRITVTATNEEQEVEQLLEAFAILKSFLLAKNYPFAT